MPNEGGNLYCKKITLGLINIEDGRVVDYWITAQDGEHNSDLAEGYSFVYDGADPVASFGCTPVGGSEPLEVICTSTSTDTVDNLEGTASLDHEWTFEGGNSEGSTSPELEVTYENDGVYTVSLTVTDDAGHSDTAITTLDGSIVVLDVDPEAAFSAVPSSGDEPLNVQFTDNSTSHDALVS